MLLPVEALVPVVVPVVLVVVVVEYPLVEDPLHEEDALVDIDGVDKRRREGTAEAALVG